MRKAYVEVYDLKQDRKIGHKFEENTRINIEKMLGEYTTNIFGKNQAIINLGERRCFAIVKDDGKGIGIYTGDLKNFQERGIIGLDHVHLDKTHIDLIKKLTL